MLEQGNYPYIPGKGGIRLDQVVVKDEQVHGLIKGGSGRSIQYTSSKHMLEFNDPNYEARMTAYVGLGTLRMALQTRNPALFRESRGRHPDFFAGKFIDVALRYFETRSIPITQFKAEWYQKSDNYFQFMVGITIFGEDPIVAAGNTWTGVALGKHGFHLSHPNEVYFAEKDAYSRQNRRVFAYFKKTT